MENVGKKSYFCIKVSNAKTKITREFVITEGDFKNNFVDTVIWDQHTANLIDSSINIAMIDIEFNQLSYNTFDNLSKKNCSTNYLT